MKYLEELNKWFHAIHVARDWANIPIISNIEKNLGLTFIPASLVSDQGSTGNVCMAGSSEVRDEYKDTFTPINLLDYMYATLHSPCYREKYEECLKVDFSRVPCPKDLHHFWGLVGVGGQLRQQYLLESPKADDSIATRPVDGDNIVKCERPISNTGLGSGDSLS